MNILLSRLIPFLLSRKKAIAGVVAPLVVSAALHFGFHVDINTATTLIVAVFTGLTVHESTNLAG